MSEMEQNANPKSSAISLWGSYNREMVWPTVKEMQTVMHCVVCKCTPTPSFLQCVEGHMICEGEGCKLPDCPGPSVTPGTGRGRCGAPLVFVTLKWYKWMTKMAHYKCPIEEDCKGLLLGQNDEKCHILKNHPQGRTKMIGSPQLLI